MALADAASGINQTIQQILAERLAAQQMAKKEEQQAFQNQRLLGADARDQQQIDATLKNNQLMQDRQSRLDAQAESQQKFNRAGILIAEATPGEFFKEDSPFVSDVKAGGREDLIPHTPELQGMGTDFTGPMPTGETPQQAQVGREAGRLFTGTNKQITDAAQQRSLASDRLSDNAANEKRFAVQEEINRGMLDVARQNADTAKTRPTNTDKPVRGTYKDPVTGRTLQAWKTPDEWREMGAVRAADPSILDNRLASADAVYEIGNNIIDQMSDPAIAQQFGAWVGRQNDILDALGNPPPEFAEIAGDVQSYALLNLGVHGMRSAQGARDIAEMLDPRLSPEARAAKIRGLSKASEILLRHAGRQPSTQGGGTQPPPAQGGSSGFTVIKRPRTP